MLERSAIAEIGGDPCCTKRMIIDWRVNAGRRSSPADHAKGVGLGHWRVDKRHGVMAWAGSKEPAFTVVRDAGSVYVSPQYLSERMVTGHRGFCHANGRRPLFRG
jgi:hypothetical protein